MQRKKSHSERPQSTSMASKITDQLRKDVLARGDGEFLGKEEEMLARYGVSRPTFRQSVRILEQEQLIEVKRGTVGGYYARKPGIQAVGRLAASYLESRGTTRDQFFEAGEAAYLKMIRLAATSKDEVARQSLAAYCQKLEHINVLMQPFEQFHVQDVEFRMQLHRLARNPALELFAEVLYQVAMDEETQDSPVFVTEIERRVPWRRMQVRLTEAVLNHEPEIAEALVKSMNAMLKQWGDDDKANLGSPVPATGRNTESPE